MRRWHAVSTVGLLLVLFESGDQLSAAIPGGQARIDRVDLADSESAIDRRWVDRTGYDGDCPCGHVGLPKCKDDVIAWLSHHPLAQEGAVVDRARDGRFGEHIARAVRNDILTCVGEGTSSTDTVGSLLHRRLDGKGNGGTARRYSATVLAFLTYFGSARGRRGTLQPTERWRQWVRTVAGNTDAVTLDLGPDWNAASDPTGTSIEAQIAQVTTVRQAMGFRPSGILGTPRG
jgi:hypothetical protein